MYRSTKGASKARRDQINAEIRSLRDLLPISEADKARLSYLHIMSLACIYTRKSVFFSQGPSVAGSHMSLSLPELSDLLHTLPGFLLLLTSEGKLLYLSDNVADFLGHSMVDLVAQSDSVYDIVDPADHFIMRGNLVPIATSDTDRLFRCRFNTSKFVRRQGAGNKMVLVRARCLQPPYQASSYWMTNPVWVCYCSPLEAGAPQASARNPLLTPPAEQCFLLSCFQSRHGRDMRIHAIQDSVSMYLGYDVNTLRSRSWYSLIHPRDLSHASAKHCALLHEEGERQVEMVVQVEAADHSWVWLYIVLQLETGEHPINSHNYIISESEAWSVRQQLNSEQDQLALLYQEPQHISDPLSSPDTVFTPSSSGLSSQSFDFSFASSGRSSSEELPGTSASSSMVLDPILGFSQEEKHSQQPQSGQQLWKSAMSVPHEHLSTFSLSSVPQSHVAPLPHPPFKTPPSRQSSEEFIYTPPYTPRTTGGSFMFGDETFRQPDHCKATKLRQTISSVPSSTRVDLPPPCRKRPYETLPPTPDSPGNDECVLMALPEIRGPLYIDVPHFPFHPPPEGLLTPEASPTKKPCLSYFLRDEETERERMEISLLAQYISSLAEGFCHSQPQNSPPPAHHTKSSLTHIDVVMLEEKELEENPCPNLPSNSTSAFPSMPAYSQCRGTPILGVNHLCSVQSAQYNGMTGVRLQEVDRLPRDLEVTSSQGSSQAPCLTPDLPCAQSLLEELVTLEPVFGAAAPISPAERQQDELYQLPHQSGPQIFYQDGTNDHMF
ncbi:hypothetical protein DNTS_013888 [Danionella cerebrum]|uniref:BHLH domain-containing protein n=1 Tax=Danionella cerebrum TaxID=2873325 RepID=A0A553QBU9_9TELE|nr:hypothetical protein DNTS_013888 [Danionella translucida]